MKSFNVIFLVILSLGAGIIISECIRRLNRKKSKIKILGTLMIPARYESMLSGFDEKLNIFIGVPGRDGSGDIYMLLKMITFLSNLMENLILIEQSGINL